MARESYQAKTQDREIYCLDLNENQCDVEFNFQGEGEPWSDGGGVRGVVMTNVKWPRVGTGWQVKTRIYNFLAGTRHAQLHQSTTASLQRGKKF